MEILNLTRITPSHWFSSCAALLLRRISSMFVLVFSSAVKNVINIDPNQCPIKKLSINKMSCFRLYECTLTWSVGIFQFWIIYRHRNKYFSFFFWKESLPLNEPDASDSAKHFLSLHVSLVCVKWIKIKRIAFIHFINNERKKSA